MTLRSLHDGKKLRLLVRVDKVGQRLLNRSAPRLLDNHNVKSLSNPSTRKRTYDIGGIKAQSHRVILDLSHLRLPLLDPQSLGKRRIPLCDRARVGALQQAVFVPLGFRFASSAPRLLLDVATRARHVDEFDAGRIDGAGRGKVAGERAGVPAETARFEADLVAGRTFAGRMTGFLAAVEGAS